MRQHPDFAVTTTFREETAVIAPVGEIDIATAGTFRAALLSATEHAEQIEVDLSRTSFMDGRGLAVLVVAAQRLGDRSSRMVVRNPPPIVVNALKASGVDALVSLRPAA